MLKKSLLSFDILATLPSTTPFTTRVQKLGLSRNLEEKAIEANYGLPGKQNQNGRKGHLKLTATEEQELAGEILLLRYKFTETSLKDQFARQAILTVIQNIYLFRHRKIFSFLSNLSLEDQRQKGTQIFSAFPVQKTLPFCYTFEHQIIARVWRRIIGQAKDTDFKIGCLAKLHETIENINTIRNIYMLLSIGFVRYLAPKVGTIYKQSLGYKDAVQAGILGIGRAAYRYHPSCGASFPTFASNWVIKEIQNQALANRLIRISSHSIEQYRQAVKKGEHHGVNEFALPGETYTDIEAFPEAGEHLSNNLVTAAALEYESKELNEQLNKEIENLCSKKARDIIKRRFGLPPYTNAPQSIIDISRYYGVTRSSIYQIEKKTLTILRKKLST